jgi:hypothetical protein
MGWDDQQDNPGIPGESLSLSKSPRSMPQRVQTVTSGSESESSSPPVEDRRVKIARRMMPAAMLKKLEQEAAAKELRRAESRRRDARRSFDSPARPGRAVIKRAGQHVDMAELLGDVVDEDIESLPLFNDGGSPANMVQRELIVISDDEDTDGSQAQEDHGVDRGLTRLFDGDFESIIAGRRKPVSKKRKAAKSTRPVLSAARRPALGLVKRMPLPGSGHKDYQARLDFPVNEKPTRRLESAKKSKPTDRTPTKAKSARRPRPAIRLDDEIIFATSDFAFETENEQSQTPRSKSKPLARIFSRTVSKTFSEPDVLDAGIGKARSWANFDKFPVDFGISPLPSGLYCSANTILGDGTVARTVEAIRKGLVQENVAVCRAYDLELRADMALTAVSSVVDILFDGILKAMLTYANDTSAELPDFSPLRFLAGYMAGSERRVDDMTALRNICREAVNGITHRIDDMLAPGSTPSKALREIVLKLRWELLSLTLQITTELDGDTSLTTVNGCSSGILRQLLHGGFDKTIKPLKAILRGEADNPEISEASVITWIAVMQVLDAYDNRASQGGTFATALDTALNSAFQLDQSGPIAAERIWFLIFGLCALSQFDVHGRITDTFTPLPRWHLVRRAVSLIKISHSEEAEERGHQDQLRGRDRYIKTIMSRCVRLSSVWKWHFDKESFTVASKDLGVIFKDRQYRNLPTEQPVDYPEWITQFDVSLTANEDTKHETAFELYLRLVCVAASDIIGSATSLVQAQQAEKDVQRLIMSIIPVSPVRFNRILPPTPKQLGQLVNRYATVVAGCYFSPALLGWLLANSKKWAPFDVADFESRQISIRGLMYIAIALRHHEQSVKPVVDRLTDIMGVLQKELDDSGKDGGRRITRKEVERTMVLVVACVKMIILHHSYDPEQQLKAAYPDPNLLHESKCMLRSRLIYQVGFLAHSLWTSIKI